MEKRGHCVAAPDLPAHGDDHSWPFFTSLSKYSAAISNVAASFDEPVIAVGHSMGGMVLTQAMADSPSLFRATVYLCAFVPMHGDSMFSLAQQDRESLGSAGTRFGIRGVSVRPEKAANLFYSGCSKEDVAWAISQLQIEPYPPLFNRFKENTTIEVPRTYIGCSEDRAITFGYQRAMASRNGIEMFATMHAGHSPFLSSPEELAGLLTKYATVNGE